jgi:hypothetical protein
MISPFFHAIWHLKFVADLFSCWKLAISVRWPPDHHIFHGRKNDTNAVASFFSENLLDIEVWAIGKLRQIVSDGPAFGTHYWVATHACLRCDGAI